MNAVILGAILAFLWFNIYPLVSLWGYWFNVAWYHARCDGNAHQHRAFSSILGSILIFESATVIIGLSKNCEVSFPLHANTSPLKHSAGRKPDYDAFLIVSIVTPSLVSRFSFRVFVIKDAK